MGQKFHFVCRSCGYEIDGFEEWFAHGQKCPKCGDNKIYTVYHTDKQKLKKLVKPNQKPTSIWHYFDFLPLNNKENIITEGEGVSPMERWEFFEKFAREKYGLNIQVIVNRNDLSPATHTFKDKGASLAASVLKEHGIKEYVVASTGNTATAFAYYLAKANISLTVFIPEDALDENAAHIGALGQKVCIVKGDYARAKQVAKEYAKKYGILISGGNLDPLRLEAKKTQAFEMLRQLGRIPDVYIQAISGGTSPFALEKAFLDFEDTNILGKMPRLLLCQGNHCAPQAEAWEKAKERGFPEGWEYDYPIYQNPKAIVPTLATGNPVLYPFMARLVKKTGGEIFPVMEEIATDIARLVAYEKTLRIGPASAVALLGFFEALHRGYIKDGEMVYINMGEGYERAYTFLRDVAYTMQYILGADECQRFDRSTYHDKVWEIFYNYEKYSTAKK